MTVTLYSGATLMQRLTDGRFELLNDTYISPFELSFSTYEQTEQLNDKVPKECMYNSWEREGTKHEVHLLIIYEE